MHTKRMPVHNLERSLKTAGLFLKLGGHSSKAMMGSLLRGKRPDLKTAFVSRQNVETAVKSLKDLRGAAMKFGQLLSLDETLVLSPELAEVLAQLRASGYAMPPRQLKAMLTANWGEGWLKKFARFDVEPFAAASIGQVHRARLHSGEELAIKVQFPNIANTIEGDLNLLRFFLNNSGMLPADLDLDHYIGVCKDQLKAETDYIEEARNVETFRSLLKGQTGFVIPKIYADLSTSQVLVMSYEDGAAIAPFAAMSMAQRTQIAAALMDLLLQEIFEFKMVQTDPNIANFMRDERSGDLILFDFGACCAISEDSFEIYRTLLQLGLQGKVEPLKTYLVQNGLLPEAMNEVGEAFLDGLLAMTLTQLHQSDDLDFSRIDVLDYLMDQDFDIYTTLLPNETIAPDLMFVQRKVVGFLLFFRSMGVTLPVLPRLRDIAAKHL